jgi:LmbE family N-acetylglucosaminyl deacetylase
MENNKPEIRELTLIAHPEDETMFLGGRMGS